MSDFYNDPNLRRDVEREFEPVSVWAGLGALAIVIGMFIVLGIFAGPTTQTATNTTKPAVETTGSGGSAPGQQPR